MLQRFEWLGGGVAIMRFEADRIGCLVPSGGAKGARHGEHHDIVPFRGKYCTRLLRFHENYGHEIEQRLSGH